MWLMDATCQVAAQLSTRQTVPGLWHDRMGLENSEELADGAAQVSRLGFGVLRPDGPNRQRTDCKAVQSMLIAGLSCEADGPLLMVWGSDTNC